MGEKATKKPPSSPLLKKRRVSLKTSNCLYAKSAGRCQICNCDLVTHPLTQTSGNYAQVAHIVAFSVNGPRGNEESNSKEIDDLANLMLLCYTCHKLIDDDPDSYPLELLKEMKKEHEDRIRVMTEIGPQMKSTVLVFKSPIRGQEVSVRHDHIREAVYPYFINLKDNVVIDLTNLKQQNESSAFLEIAKNQIECRVALFHSSRGERYNIDHHSIFAIGPIVQLMILGTAIGSKVPATLYQFHRDTQDWKWKNKGEEVKYKLNKIQVGCSKSFVALILSLSGTVPFERLPDNYQKSATVYEITLENQIPNPTFLKKKSDLEEFKLVYLKFLALISKEHGLSEQISVFPAIPAPVAVLCGRERLPKVHPQLRVYDYDYANQGFTFQSIIGE